MDFDVLIGNIAHHTALSRPDCMHGVWVVLNVDALKRMEHFAVFEGYVSNTRAPVLAMRNDRSDRQACTVVDIDVAYHHVLCAVNSRIFSSWDIVFDSYSIIIAGDIDALD